MHKVEIELEKLQKIVEPYYLSNPLASTIFSKQKSLVLTDSRLVGDGDIFICIPGTKLDGHNYIDHAMKQGASIIIGEQPQKFFGEIPYIQVESSRQIWSLIASAAYGFPEKKLTIHGVTGTNGKSSCIHYLREIFGQLDVKCATIGTLGANIDNEFYETSHTTPDPDSLFFLLNLCVRKKIKHVAMEVSSHAIAQKKVFPIKFSSIVWTSFSQDHLDYHHTLENYWNTKFSILEQNIGPNSQIYICDKVRPPEEVATKFPNNTLFYGTNNNDNDIFILATDKKLGSSNVEITLLRDKWQGQTKLFADFQIENFAVSLILALRSTNKMVSPQAWPHIPQPPGRLELVLEKPTTTFIDYAHTPDALDKTLSTLKQLKAKKLIVVFGCGGDRDQEKRPIMGAVAQKHADVIYLTNDNPRTEDPEKIINDISKGIVEPKVHIVFDRKTAITMALEHANEQDIVVVAGKGHENYQVIGSKRVPYSDREVILEFNSTTER